MLVNILIFIVAGAFSIYVIYSACRKYIGRNPQAPSLWARIKAWWPGFVKRYIVDDDPYQDESHAGTRYDEAQKIPKCTRPTETECHAHSEDKCYNYFQCEPKQDDGKPK